MAVYREQLTERLRDLEFAGRCDLANGRGSDANFNCGCVVRFFISVDDAERAVANAGYETNGCGFMIAAAESIARYVSGRHLSEFHGLRGDSFADEIGEIEKLENYDRGGCADAAVSAVRRAFSDHRLRLIEEFAGEKSLICTCFGVSEETVERYVNENRPTDAVQVADATGAGSGCGSCRMLVQEIIDSSNR